MSKQQPISVDHQEFIGAIAGPQAIPVRIHGPTKTRYIPLKSIHKIFPDMKYMELDGVRIEPNIGFKSISTSDDEDGDGDRSMEAMRDTMDGNRPTLGGKKLEHYEELNKNKHGELKWIAYLPGKVIAVVLESISSTRPTSQKQSHHQQQQLLPQQERTSSPSHISSASRPRSPSRPTSKSHLGSLRSNCGLSASSDSSSDASSDSSSNADSTSGSHHSQSSKRTFPKDYWNIFRSKVIALLVDQRIELMEEIKSEVAKILLIAVPGSDPDIIEIDSNMDTDTDGDSVMVTGTSKAAVDASDAHIEKVTSSPQEGLDSTKDSQKKQASRNISDPLSGSDLSSAPPTSTASSSGTNSPGPEKAGSDSGSDYRPSGSRPRATRKSSDPYPKKRLREPENDADDNNAADSAAHVENHRPQVKHTRADEGEQSRPKNSLPGSKANNTVSENTEGHSTVVGERHPRVDKELPRNQNERPRVERGRLRDEYVVRRRPDDRSRDRQHLRHSGEHSDRDKHPMDREPWKLDENRLKSMSEGQRDRQPLRRTEDHPRDKSANISRRESISGLANRKRQPDHRPMREYGRHGDSHDAKQVGSESKEQRRFDPYRPDMPKRRLSNDQRQRMSMQGDVRRESTQAEPDREQKESFKARLFSFVTLRNGTVTRDQEVKLTLTNSRDVTEFSMLLSAEEYDGAVLRLTLDWSWKPSDMKQLVDVIKARRSTIKDLVLNCCYAADQDGDKANSSRWDQVAAIFHAKSLRHLRLLSVPDIITMSNPHLPLDMSRLETLRLWIDPGDNSFNGNKFHELIKRAKSLRRLILDCPATKCFEVLKQLKVVFKELKGQGQGSRSTDIEFKHGNHSVIFALMDRATAELREFKLQITNELLDQIQWVDFFKSGLLRQLTTLDLDSCRGEGWVPEVLRWIKNEGRYSQSTLRTLHLDCQIIKNSKWSEDLCELIALIRGSLETLRLEGLYFDKTKKDRTESEEGELEDGEVPVDSSDRHSSREWAVFFRALNLKRLRMLHIEKGNLGNEDLATLVKYMPIMKHKRFRLQLSATFVTEDGRKALEAGANAKGWITDIEITDPRPQPLWR